jgi:6-phosphogluconolactonase (cycloisomerase 2 family)
MKPILTLSTLSLLISTAASASQFVYVESNIAQPGANSILAYQTAADGSLQALKNSPYLTGGSGFTDSSFALGPFDSDQNVITNPDHSLLFAVNSGSNSIAVFHIDQQGSLSPVAGSPFASYGIQPVSLGYNNGILVVVNKHQDPAQASDQSLPNYTTFSVNKDGSLSHIANSTIDVANGSSPSQALVYKNLIFGADFLGGLLQSFQLNRGYLKQNLPVSLPNGEFVGVAAPHVPLGLEVNPNAPVLYVGYPTASKIGVYTLTHSGTPQFGKTVANSGLAVCWLKTNRAGTRLYTSNSADHSISVYDTTNPYEPTEIQKLVVNTDGALFQIALDSTNSYLYALEQRSAANIAEGLGNAIHVLKIDALDGKVSEVADATQKLILPDGTRPQGIATW